MYTPRPRTRTRTRTRIRTRTPLHSDAVSVLMIPVTTFHRVFDTVPVQEVVTLPELVSSLRRFELRPGILARTQREVGRIRRSVNRVKGGLHASGRYEPALKKAAEAAPSRAARPAAVEAAGLKLEREAEKEGKKNLRIWSPTRYRPGAQKRGGEHVTHVSCLVLDFDDGTPPGEAANRWERWFHIVHSTWSHTEEHPRFRLVLPLAHPVVAEEWPLVWEWASRRTGGAIDAALKNPSSHYALPAVPNENHPRFAFSRPGELLHPAAEGVVEQAPDLALVPMHPTDGTPSIMRGEDPTRRYVTELDEESLYFAEEPWNDDVEPYVAPPAELAPEPPPTADPIDELRARLERRARRRARPPAPRDAPDPAARRVRRRR